MRSLAACVVAFCLVAPPAIARAARAGGGEENPKTSTTSTPMTGTADPREEASSGDSPARPVESRLENELEQLRDLLESQAKKLQEQSEQLEEQQQKMRALEERLLTSGPRENLAAAAPISAPPAVSIPPTGAVANALSTSAASKAPNQDKPADAPMALRFKGITLTPSGYMAAETVW